MNTPLPRKRTAAALLLSMLAGGALLLHRTPSWAADPPNVVNNVADGGPNTLRDAIIYANAHPGTAIQFKIPVLPPGEIAHTISPLTPLPTITAAGTIFDGASQTLLTGDSNPAGPEIVLNGSFGGAFSSGLMEAPGW